MPNRNSSRPPSVDGISHSPKEYTRPVAMANGADVLLGTVLAVDGGRLEAELTGLVVLGLAGRQVGERVG